MSLPLFSTPVRQEQDIVFARQRTRQISEMLGFDTVEQTRLATGLSEIARNALFYANGGKVEFLLENSEDRTALIIRVSDKGTGINNLDEIYSGGYTSKTGMGLGIIGSRKIMDDFTIKTSSQGTIVTLIKNLPHGRTIASAEIKQITTKLFQEIPLAPIGEVQQQNRELLETLQELERRRERVEFLNVELEEKNRGIITLYAELDERAEQLRLADQMKTRFLSYMTHEFRTPVNSTISLTRMLLRRMDGELTLEQEKQLQLIHHSMEGLLVLVNDLLDLAKVEAGRVAIHPEDCSVEDIFSALRGMFRPLISNPDLELVFDLPPDLPKLYTDEAKVSQILRNFISNAIKFTERGEVKVSASYDTSKDSILFSVQDTGIGIAQEDQEHIFKDFGQIFNTLQKKARGTGLGLPLSRKLAEFLGGEVSLKSELGKGSTIKCVIPVFYNEEKSPLEESSAKGKGLEKPSAVHPDPLRVMIIDDDEASYYAVKHILIEAGHSVMELSMPEEAVSFARSTSPSLILLDLSMPRMRGEQVLEELKEDERTRSVPVIIFSNSIISEQQKSYFAQHANDFLSKELPLDALQTYLNELPIKVRQWRGDKL